MSPVDCPLRAADRILTSLPSDVRVVLMDFHAEATSDMQLMGRYLDGRVTAVLGTHTHVQTADEKVSAQGTAYISDAGMTGATHSVIGMDPRPVLEGIRTGLPQRYMPGKGDVELQGVIIDVDDSTGLATRITRVKEPLPEEDNASD